MEIGEKSLELSKWEEAFNKHNFKFSVYGDFQDEEQKLAFQLEGGCLTSFRHPHEEELSDAFYSYLEYLLDLKKEYQVDKALIQESCFMRRNKLPATLLRCQDAFNKYDFQFKVYGDYPNETGGKILHIKKRYKSGSSYTSPYDGELSDAFYDYVEYLLKMKNEAGIE